MAVKLKFISDPIYKAWLGVVIGSYAECEKMIEKRHKFKFLERFDPDNDRVPLMSIFYVTLVDNRVVFYLWMPDWEFDKEYFSSLAHEVTHFAIRVMDTIGMGIGISTTEPFAYYVQYIYKEVIRTIEDMLYEPDYKTCKPAMEYMKNEAYISKWCPLEDFDL